MFRIWWCVFSAFYYCYSGGGAVVLPCSEHPFWLGKICCVGSSRLWGVLNASLTYPQCIWRFKWTEFCWNADRRLLFCNNGREAKSMRNGKMLVFDCTVTWRTLYRSSCNIFNISFPFLLWFCVEGDKCSANENPLLRNIIKYGYLQQFQFPYSPFLVQEALLLLWILSELLKTQ